MCGIHYAYIRNVFITDEITAALYRTHLILGFITVNLYCQTSDILYEEKEKTSKCKVTVQSGSLK